MATGTGSVRIIVVRHAKAEGQTHDDAARRLTERGVADAAKAGRAVAAALDADRQPGRVVALVSSAARTRQTWEAVAAVLDDSGLDGGADGEVVVQVSDGLYQAGVDEVVEMLRQLPADVTAAIVVGHNPTMAGLLLELSADTESPARTRLTERGMPTASVGVLSAGVGWAQLEPGGSRLEQFTPGRE